MEENNVNNQEDLGTALKVVSFCIPLVGAILYFVHKKDAPLKSKQACNMALIGFGVGIVIQVIMTVLGIGAGAALQG
ncbi:hypothetical protein [Pseudofulvibacter geojedonensis]|uniref:DUF4190 domain-containing protein n=1 Tax=Pseudofulvibacter geojedonensis TaxID=1123758 RepID=A0ABW3I4N0_9FLAO